MIKLTNPSVSSIHELWQEYKSEVFFGIVLAAAMVLSYWLAAYIPEDVFETLINPIEYIATAGVCFFGGWVMLRHHEGMIIRKSWAAVLLIWGTIDLVLIILRFGFHISAVGSTPDNPLYNVTVTVGNILTWLLFIYPTQALRPGWLTWWKALLFIVPVMLIGVLDYFVDANLLLLLMVYPIVIFLLICQHIRNYRLWCENNYSSMEHIDVQWIVRYLIILGLLGIAFFFICFWYVPNRMFTQQWMILLIFVYSTEQILFRKDPWENVQRDEAYPYPLPEGKGKTAETGIDDTYRKKLEQWLSTEKPYLNPEFKLIDLMRVLPMNRTYLSQFINDTYGCSFYQFVNRYRIEEAQRLMREHPDMRLSDVAARSGFSSRESFARTFSQLTGTSPREWVKCNNS